MRNQADHLQKGPDQNDPGLSSY